MLLTAPEMCSLQLVDDIVAERQGGKNAGFFAGVAQSWRDRIQAYIDAAGSPALVSVWPDIEQKRNSFLNLYLSPAEGSVQGVMLASLRDHDLSLCPACGEPGAPNTLDHYLPKGKYPHFCVTPYNLFPMCDACQTEKGEKTGDVANPRFFLHPYFDAFVANQVLELSIWPPFDTPTFDLRPIAALPAPQATLVITHVRELGIIPRYARFFRNEYQRLLRSVAHLRAADLNVSEHLESFRDLAATPTTNAWNHVFYAAVLANPDLLEHLSDGELPAYQ
jgi:hypothetical protein